MSGPKYVCNMTDYNFLSLTKVLEDVAQERRRQHEKWGQQDLPDGTGLQFDDRLAVAMRLVCEKAFNGGDGTYRYILEEEVREAFAETDPEKLRAELIQVAAVAVQWVQAIDRRTER